MVLSGIAVVVEEGNRLLDHHVGLVWVAPFVLLLLSIAVLPLLVPHWWESNLNKGIISALFALPVVFYIFRLESSRLIETGVEYAAFMALLSALFIIAGGICLRGSLPGTPLINTVVLAIGAIFSNIIGTTGASMLLIRPILRANERRRHQVHIVVFFIFIVSNIGGMLTPLGDPPLFLGFLRGVPFEWTIRLLPHWFTMITTLLMIFYIWDRRQFEAEQTIRQKTGRMPSEAREKLSVEGKVNFLLLLGVLMVAFVVGRFGDRIGLESEYARRGGQIVGMGILAGLSMLMTRQGTRAANSFTLHPIVEVAVIFAGIFATMIPALVILESRGGELGLTHPWQFFWVTGLLSSFLDNAPTYLTFASMASGLMGTEAANLGLLLTAITGSMHGETLLRAISVGAVAMGANTYIGNGPNFMVKAIAEEAGVNMPSFFGYMKYTAGILFPLFLLVTFLFFRS